MWSGGVAGLGSTSFSVKYFSLRPLTQVSSTAFSSSVTSGGGAM